MVRRRRQWPLAGDDFRVAIFLGGLIEAKDIINKAAVDILGVLAALAHAVQQLYLRLEVRDDVAVAVAASVHLLVIVYIFLHFLLIV